MRNWHRPGCQLPKLLLKGAPGSGARPYPNPPTREQGTDRPGRSAGAPGAIRSTMEEADWHHLAKERFAHELAKALYLHTHANRSERLVIVAPPRILGNLRKAFHAEVIDRIAAEIPSDLTAHPLAEIEKLIAA